MAETCAVFRQVAYAESEINNGNEIPDAITNSAADKRSFLKYSPRNAYCPLSVLNYSGLRLLFMMNPSATL